MSNKRVLVPLAEGFEELEAITIIDILRRAELDVVTAGLAPGVITASRKTRHVPDTGLDDILTEKFSMIVLPGGLPGADNLAGDQRILNIINIINEEKNYIGAICAAPKILARAGVLVNRRATAYSGVLENLNLASTQAAIEHDGNIITSRGPGTALDFALYLVKLLSDEDIKTKVEESLLRR